MVFELHREILLKVGIIRNCNNKIASMGPFQCLIVVLAYLSLILFLISSVVYVMKFKSVDIESTFYAMMQAFALTAVVYSVAEIYFRRLHIFTVIELIEKIRGKH